MTIKEVIEDIEVIQKVHGNGHPILTDELEGIKNKLKNIQPDYYAVKGELLDYEAVDSYGEPSNEWDEIMPLYLDEKLRNTEFKRMSENKNYRKLKKIELIELQEG